MKVAWQAVGVRCVIDIIIEVNELTHIKPEYERRLGSLSETNQRMRKIRKEKREEREDKRRRYEKEERNR